MQIITLKEPNRGPQIFQAGRGRYSTVTDVAFITETRVAVIHRNGCKAYLIDLDHTTQTHIIVYTLDVGMQTEMLVYEGGKLYMITFTDTMFILEIEENILKIIKTVKFVKNATYHGLEARGGFLYLTPSPTQMHDHGKIIKYDLLNDTFACINSPDLKLNYRLKDITFLRDDLIVIIIVLKTHTSMTQTQHTSDAMIGLFDGEFRLLDSLQFKKTHFDSVIAHGDSTVYATMANEKGGFIMKCDIQNRKFIKGVDYIKTGDFPHGIDIYDNKLAYTSYSDSTLCIMDLN